MLSRPYKLLYAPAYMSRAFIVAPTSVVPRSDANKVIGTGALQTKGSAGIGAGGSAAQTGYRQPNNAGTKIPARGSTAIRTTNPGSGCSNCTDKQMLEWVQCQFEKAFICEPNAVKDKAINRGVAAGNDVGAAITGAFGNAGKTLQDAGSSTIKVIQETLGGNANAIQEWFSGSGWILPVGIVGGLILLLVIVRR